MDTTEHNDETPAEQPRADRWELAPEPEPGTVVQDRNGAVWTRRMNSYGWTRAGVEGLVTWATVLSGAPLARLVPAGAAMPDADLRRVTDERDQARANLRRYLGTRTLRDAARKVVSDYGRAWTGTNRELDNSVRALRRLLGEDDAGTGPRVVTYDRDAILERAAETLSRHRRAVVAAARRVLDAVDNDSDVDIPIFKLRAAMIAMDRHLTETMTD